MNIRTYHMRSPQSIPNIYSSKATNTKQMREIITSYSFVSLDNIKINREPYYMIKLRNRTLASILELNVLITKTPFKVNLQEKNNFQVQLCSKVLN